MNATTIRNLFTRARSLDEADWPTYDEYMEAYLEAANSGFEPALESELLELALCDDHAHITVLAGDLVDAESGYALRMFWSDDEDAYCWVVMHIATGDWVSDWYDIANDFGTLPGQLNWRDQVPAV
jgi:hypothetical protein